MERRDYLELMTGQIRCKKMCPVIAKEVEDHIEDQKQAFMAEGMKEEWRWIRSTDRRCHGK